MLTIDLHYSWISHLYSVCTLKLIFNPKSILRIPFQPLMDMCRKGRNLSLITCTFPTPLHRTGHPSASAPPTVNMCASCALLTAPVFASSCFWGSNLSLFKIVPSLELKSCVAFLKARSCAMCLREKMLDKLCLGVNLQGLWR